MVACHRGEMSKGQLVMPLPTVFSPEKLASQNLKSVHPNVDDSAKGISSTVEGTHHWWIQVIAKKLLKQCKCVHVEEALRTSDASQKGSPESSGSPSVALFVHCILSVIHDRDIMEKHGWLLVGWNLSPVGVTVSRAPDWSPPMLSVVSLKVLLAAQHSRPN